MERVNPVVLDAIAVSSSSGEEQTSAPRGWPADVPFPTLAEVQTVTRRGAEELTGAVQELERRRPRSGTNLDAIRFNV